MFCRKGLQRGVCPSRYLMQMLRNPFSVRFLLLDAVQRLHDSRSICLYNNTLLNCFPGDWRTMPFISRSKSVARTCEEFKPELSTMSSMCLGSSALSNSNTFFSKEFSDAATIRFLCSASG